MEVCLDQTDSTCGHPSQVLATKAAIWLQPLPSIDGGENHHSREWGSFEEELLDQQQGQFAGRPVVR